MTHDELLKTLLGQSTDGVATPADQYRIGDISDAEIEETDWLWPGHILRGQLTLLDAKGGSGKTRLFLAMAACGSLGKLPFGLDGAPIDIPKFRTLLFTTEDDRGDIKAVYRSMGGDMAYLEVWDAQRYGQFTLDEDGLTRLSRMIEVNQFAMVGFDPVLQYLPRDVRSQNDNIAITQFLARKREVARTTGASIINVRHWSRESPGREVYNMGAGGESWRNSSRGQMVMFPHPDNSKHFFQSIAVCGRATIRTVDHAPFGIEITNGRQVFVHPDQLDLQPYADAYDSIRRKFGLEQSTSAPKARFHRGERGPNPDETEFVGNIILTILHDGPMRTGPLIEEVKKRAADKDRSVSNSTFYRAKRQLSADSKISETHGVMTINSSFDFDPFAD